MLLKEMKQVWRVKRSKSDFKSYEFEVITGHSNGDIK